MCGVCEPLLTQDTPSHHRLISMPPDAFVRADVGVELVARPKLVVEKPGACSFTGCPELLLHILATHYRASRIWCPSRSPAMRHMHPTISRKRTNRKDRASRHRAFPTLGACLSVCGEHERLRSLPRAPWQPETGLHRQCEGEGRLQSRPCHRCLSSILASRLMGL